jgi:predicted DNA-binding transcriptional regulator YafY
MRASRLLSIQLLLQSRGRMSAAALAEALEVSVRTRYRDVDQLSAAGVPVYAERGRHGGFQLMAGWSTPLTGLTPGESRAVLLGGLPGPAAQLGLGAEVETARLKLLAALPAAWRDDAQRIGTRLHVDPLEWYRDNEPLPQLGVVAEAVWNGRRLAMRYASWKAAAARRVSPLGLVLKAGAWYLVASADDGTPRTWRVSNIAAPELLPERVRRPRGFDLARYWADALRRFDAERMRAQASVLATPEGVTGLRRLDSAVARAIDTQRPATHRADGRVRLRVPIESVAHASAQLLRLAPEVEVMGPAALRAAIVERLERLNGLYGLARPAGIEPAT